MATKGTFSAYQRLQGVDPLRPLTQSRIANADTTKKVDPADEAKKKKKDFLKGADNKFEVDPTGIVSVDSLSKDVINQVIDQKNALQDQASSLYDSGSTDEALKMIRRSNDLGSVVKNYADSIHQVGVFTEQFAEAEKAGLVSDLDADRLQTISSLSVGKGLKGLYDPKLNDVVVSAFKLDQKWEYY